MFPAMEDLPQILTTEAGWTPKYEKIVHINNMEHVSHKRTLHQTLDPCLPCTVSFTKHATKQFPVQQLTILYSKYGTRNNKVKSLMRATQGLVPLTDENPGGCPPGLHVYCCILLQSGSMVRA